MNEIAGQKATVATIGGAKETLVFGARYDVRYNDDDVLRGAILAERGANGDLFFVRTDQVRHGIDPKILRVRIRPSRIDAIVERDPSTFGIPDGVSATDFLGILEGALGSAYTSFVGSDLGQRALRVAYDEDRAGRNGKVRKADPEKVATILSTIYPGVVATNRTTSLDDLASEERLAETRRRNLLSAEDQAREDALARGVRLAEDLASDPAFRDREDAADAIAAEVARQIPELAAPAGAPSGLSPAEEIALDLVPVTREEISVGSARLAKAGRKTATIGEVVAAAKGRPYAERNQVWRCGSCKRRTRAAFCENGHARVDAPAGKRREDRGSK